jgi:UDP-N-acetylmuramoyl-tripeptide--D-alanyl-D-alanine ligase
VYLVGNIFQKAQELTYAYIFETVDQLNEELKQNPMVGYYVLLKGSHSVRLEKAIPFL